MSSAVVLSIDDDHLVLQLVRKVCQHAGYEFHGAISGENGLTLLKTLHPNVIVLDIDMPGMSGIETHREIRSRFPNLRAPIIFLSATRDVGVISAVADLHSRFLVKPIHPRRLLEKIAQALQTS